ncbi:CNDP1 isoform 4, partial [Pan troglodytes]
ADQGDGWLTDPYVLTEGNFMDEERLTTKALSWLGSML